MDAGVIVLGMAAIVLEYQFARAMVEAMKKALDTIP